jgi:Fe-S-cluster containining protein
MKCEGCSAPCCKKFIKFITAHDLKRIADGLKLEPVNFVDIYPASEVNSTMPQIRINNKKYLLALDSKMGNKDCIFIMNLGNSRKCGIHSLRPMGCRTYPFILMSDEFTLGLTTEFICPRQWFPENEEKIKYLLVLRQQRKEQEEYFKIVEEWNDSHGEHGSFMQFIDFSLSKVQL